VAPSWFAFEGFSQRLDEMPGLANWRETHSSEVLSGSPSHRYRERRETDALGLI
jgi:hypothetical protein